MNFILLNVLNSNLVTQTNRINTLASERARYFLDEGMTRLTLNIASGRGAIVFYYTWSSTGVNGLPVSCLGVRKSHDNTSVVLNTLDGTTLNVSAVCTADTVTLDFSNVTIHGYVRVFVLYF